ncbi:hypothetical protein BRADI_2g07096v3, partial [Brachypodium distachyon]
KHRIISPKCLCSSSNHLQKYLLPHGALPFFSPRAILPRPARRHRRCLLNPPLQSTTTQTPSRAPTSTTPPTPSSNASDDHAAAADPRQQEDRVLHPHPHRPPRRRPPHERHLLWIGGSNIYGRSLS